MFKWYMKGAKQGHRDSQYNVGVFYRKGEVVKQGTGVKQSNRWAKHYFEKATESGHKKAAKKLKTLP